MNSRQRFLETLCGGNPDHPPLFLEGIRDEVLQVWQSQGLARGSRLQDLFYYDDFEELAPDVYPEPEIEDWSDKKAVLGLLEDCLDPADPGRLPQDWPTRLGAWQDRQYPLFLRIHTGLFQSLGVGDWRRFSEVIQLLADDPAFVQAVLAVQSAFAARLAENILQQVDVDALIFSEPIAGNHGPLISPRMYRELVLASFKPIFDVLDRFRVPVVIWRSYANPLALVPEVCRSGFSAIWICEAPPSLDYAGLRHRQGPELGLIGGIDSDVLRSAPQEMRRAVEAVLPLVEGGRFIPLADGRVREEIPLENYLAYRRLLEELFL